ncbi:MAG: SRPBCC family protein [Planctomycetota bacterium]
MAKFSISEHVTAPREVVFEVASDLHNAADNIQGIDSLEVLTDGPIGVGTRFRETRVMMGKSSTEEMEITAFDAPHSYVVETESCGCHFRCEYRFVGDISGTNVRLTFDTSALSFFAKLMAPLSSLMMGPMKKCVAADLADLKSVAESKARQLEQA